MKRILLAAILILLSLPSCKERDKEKVYDPAVRLELQSLLPTKAVFAVNTLDATSLLYGWSASGEPSLGDSLDTGGTGPGNVRRRGGREGGSRSAGIDPVGTVEIGRIAEGQLGFSDLVDEPAVVGNGYDRSAE